MIHTCFNKSLFTAYHILTRKVHLRISFTYCFTHEKITLQIILFSSTFHSVYYVYKKYSNHPLKDFQKKNPPLNCQCKGKTPGHYNLYSEWTFVRISTKSTLFSFSTCMYTIEMFWIPGLIRATHCSNLNLENLIYFVFTILIECST